MLRKPHGAGAVHGPGGPRVEVARPRDLPRGVQAPTQATAGPERDQHGRFLPGARSAQSKGARAKNSRVRLARQLGLESLADCPDFAPYIREAEDFAKAQANHLAERVGGGSVGPDVGSMVASASWQIAASRYLFARAVREGGDPDLFAKASRLANDGRQNQLAAYELAAKAAQAQAQHRGPQPLAIPSSPIRPPVRPSAALDVTSAPPGPASGQTDSSGAPGAGEGDA
jgi:hypothetical protein